MHFAHRAACDGWFVSRRTYNGALIDRMSGLDSTLMRVCFVSAFYEDSWSTGADVIQRNYTLREFAKNVSALGHDVDVIQLFHRNESSDVRGVTYHFVRPLPAVWALATLAAYFSNGRSRCHYLAGTSMIARIHSLRPDVIHFFGLTLDINLWLVARLATRRKTPLVVQYHGGGPARNSIRRRIQRSNLRSATRILFTTRSHAQAWVDEGIPIDCHKIVPFMETSSVFRRESRQSSREKTGMVGDPVFLWTGRLHPEKDPMTAVRAFERISRHWQGARLYMYYLTDELLPDLQGFVSQTPSLSGKIHFCGRTAHDSMQAIYNSADFFMQASTRETSGCAVLEAMSCGAIPVISDIPSFSEMTCNGQHGVLFPVGDIDALVDGVLRISLASVEQRSDLVREYWERALSFPALANQLVELYTELSVGHCAQPDELEPRLCASR